MKFDLIKKVGISIGCLASKTSPSEISAPMSAFQKEIFLSLSPSAVLTRPRCYCLEASLQKPTPFEKAPAFLSYLQSNKDNRPEAIKAFIDTHHLLSKALESEERALVLQLIKAKADVNNRDPKGKTPLHYAAQSTFYEFARLLLTKGARYQYPSSSRNG